jgi:hypothetical protein
MARIYFVDVWDTFGLRHEDAVSADSPEDAARDLGSRVFPDGLDVQSDAWRAEAEDDPESVWGTARTADTWPSQK